MPIRDLIANISYGDWLFTGLTAFALIPEIGDTSKAVSKVVDFILAGAKNADEAVAAMKVMNNVIPPVYDGVKHSDEFVDGVKRFSCLDVAKMLPALDDAPIRKVLNISAKSGDVNSSEIIKAFRDVEDNDPLKLFRTYVEGTEFTSFAEYRKNYENIPKNVSGFGDELSQFVKRSVSPQQAAMVMEACSKHGDTVLKAINKCGDEYAELIARCVSHEKFANGVTTQFLNAMTDHSDSMIKAIKVCGVENYDTIADYSRIFGKFGNNAETIVEKFLVKKFIGLDEVLNSKSPMVCFGKPNGNDEICIVVASGVKSHNPTIKFLVKDFGQSLSAGEYMKNYSELLTPNGLQDMINSGIIKDQIVNGVKITKEEIANEMTNYIDAIKEARGKALKELLERESNDPNFKISQYDFSKKTGITNDYSLYNDRTITNCAEIWCARDMILRGYKFDDCEIVAFFNSGKRIGEVNPPCANCKNVGFK